MVKYNCFGDQEMLKSSSPQLCSFLKSYNGENLFSGRKPRKQMSGKYILTLLFFSMKICGCCLPYLEVIKMIQPFFQEVSVKHCVYEHAVAKYG